MKNDLLKIINSRRTIRVYDNHKKVSDDIVNNLLESARLCQSAHNMQPWKFIVLRDREKINAIADAMINASKDMHIGFNILMKDASTIVKNAPLVILVHNTRCITRKFSKLGELYSDLGELYEMQSIAAAIQNISLTASISGIGLAWIGIALFCANDINAIVDEAYPLAALLTMGYPGETPKAPQRKAINEIAVFK